MTSPYDHVQVVRACFSGSQELEPREPVQRWTDQPQRCDPDQLRAVADLEQPEAARIAEVRPPRVQPFPGQERIVTGTRLEQLGPLTAERCEALHVLDAGDRDGVRLHHAAAPRPRPDICRAM